MATIKHKILQHFIDRGFTKTEASAFSKGYTYQQVKTLPYFRNMKRNRLLYVNNLKSRGFSPTRIKQYVKALSVKKGWVDKDGNPDAWAMLRAYRKGAIDKGEYAEVKKPHHKKATSDEEIAKQRARPPRLSDRTRSSLQNRLEAINTRLQRGNIQYVDEYERLVSEKQRIEKRLGR